MRFQVGQKVGDYEFLAIEETTPTGETYRVHNILAARDEVLKVLPRELLQDAEGVERFLREAKIHARLRHPNIAAFYNATRMEGQLVMTSERVEGKSLAQLLAGGAITVGQAAKYFEQVLSALSYAHREGVVHRDLTPNNLIIAPNDTVKVTGFGLAKKSSDPQLTQPGIVLGSIHYMSPEQVKGSSDLDVRSDIYSLGVVLYEAVTGKKPFDSKSDFEVFFAHVNKDPEPPSKVRPEIPPQFDQLVMTAMAKHPGNRYQTADEFRDSLNQFRDSLGRLRSVVDSAADSRPMSPAMPPATWAEMADARSHAAPKPAADPSASAAEELRSPDAETPRVPAELPGWEDPPRVHQYVASTKSSEVAKPNNSADLGNFISSRPEWNLQELRKPPSRKVAPPPVEAKDPWNELDEQPKQVPLLLRTNSEDAANWRGTPAQEPEPEAPAAKPASDEQALAGWSTKDIVAVGALTIVIVSAIIFAMLTFLNR